MKTETQEPKPIDQLETKEEMIAERDRMEAQWNKKLHYRMVQLNRLSWSRYKTTIGRLK